MADDTEVKASDATTVSAKVTSSGWRTSEFWIAVLTSVGAVAATIGGVLDPKIGGILIAISTVAYSLSRGLAKGG